MSHRFTWPNHLANTRTIALPSIGSVDAPTLDELNGPDAIELTCDLSEDGLDIDRGTGGAEFTPWFGNHTRGYPTRWTPTVTMQALVPPQCDQACPIHTPDDPDCCVGVLWEMSCKFRCDVVLVVRRACPFDTPWHAGQKVEVLRGRWGARNVSPLADAALLFTVPILVIEEAGFNPDTNSCSGTTTIVPGTDPLPDDECLCLADGVTGFCDESGNQLATQGA